MKKRFLSCLLCLVCLFAAIMLWSNTATANHPVKEISVRVLRAQPHFSGWTTADNVMRQVEFANRVYANANIKFKFDPVYGFADTTDPDFACWADDVVDDVQFANAYADYYYQDLLVVVPLYRAEGDGFPCVTGACTVNTDCCPNLSEWDMSQVPPVRVCQAAVRCEPGLNRCIPSNYSAGGLVCFGSQCQAHPDGCHIPRDPISPKQEYVRFRPMFNDGIMKLAHESGHHFGLHHPWDDPLDRCYDTAEGDMQSDCGSQPAGCTGASGTCPATQPWRNIMTYYDTCQATYAGQLTPGAWNESLSNDQIGIVRRALDEWWDQVLADADDGEYKYGNYEMMQLVTSGTPWEYRTWDSLSTVWRTTTGESGWTRGNVKIKAADVNGDGLVDAIVSAASGAHPNTTLWTRGVGGSLSFAQSLVGSGGVNVTVNVGNAMGDGGDDVFITQGSWTYYYRGQYGASTMTYVGALSSGTGAQVYVGNFGGQHEEPVGLGGTVHSYHQGRVNSGIHPSISYDDVLVVRSGGADIYYGASTFNTAADVTTTLYSSSSVLGAWAANMGGDFHDELVIRNASGLHVVKGADAFAFGTEYTIWSYPSTDSLRVSLGDLTFDHWGDMLVTAPTGTKLYAGGATGPAFIGYNRTDLTFANTKHVTADFVRRGRDDVIYFTTSGSWLYAGVKDYPWLASGVWNDAAYTYSNSEWSGTQ